jgi:DNA-binding GntR family transcriptional regulator
MNHLSHTNDARSIIQGHPKGKDAISFVKPNSVVHTVADYLRESIVTGNLRPGEKISGNKIAEDLGVSSIPVREALRIMEKEGLVETFPGRGCWVSKVSRRDLEESFELRIFLELLGIDLLKKRISDDPEAVRELKEINIVEYAEKLGAESCEVFHRRLIELTGNKKLLTLYQFLLNSTRRYQRMDYTIRHGGYCCIEPHSAILTPLKGGNYEKAKKAIRAHLTDGKEKLLAHIDFSE